MFKMFAVDDLFARTAMSRHERSWNLGSFFLAGLLILAMVLAAVVPGHAQSTVFLTDRNGQIPFPILPPNRATGGPGSIDNMTIGATTPRPGSFTTLSSTSAPSGAGVTALFASPPAIGSGTPAAGTFSVLRYTSQLQPGSGLPTIASGACGATTNGAIVAGSTNQAGSLTIGAAATTTCTVSFSAALPVAPKACAITPMNAAAADQATTVMRIGAPSTTGFVITGDALANANYSFICL